MYAQIYRIYHACMPVPSSSIMPGFCGRGNGHKASAAIPGWLRPDASTTSAQHTHPTDTPPSHQARRCSCSSIGAPERAHLPQRHRPHLHPVLHARARGRCKKTLVIQNSHSFLIRSAGKTPPTCDEIVDLRHSACGHNYC